MVVPKRDRPSPSAGVVCKAKTETVKEIAIQEGMEEKEEHLDEGTMQDGDMEDKVPEAVEAPRAPLERSTVVSISNDDVTKIVCRGRPSVSVGDLVRMKEKLSEQDSCPCAGQVLAIEKIRGQSGSGTFAVTVRRGRCYLVTSRGRVKVQTGDTVNQGDVIGTEDLIAPRTSDIVQGLPRIEKIFEASNGHLQEQLDALWEKARYKHTDFDAAIIARDTMRQEVVAELQGAYGEQGVGINSKHIEVVVRRMTDKCEILESAGAALQPGTVVDYTQVEALHALQPQGQVRARPRIRGITEVGKQCDHVLVAMGFREVDNLLTNSVAEGPRRHSMEGVKENLMVGKAANVGSKDDDPETDDPAVSIDYELIPERT